MDPAAGGREFCLNAEHVTQVAEFADAAVIGSAIVELIERSTPEAAPGAVARFIRACSCPRRLWSGKRIRRAAVVPHDFNSCFHAPCAQAFE